MIVINAIDVFNNIQNKTKQKTKSRNVWIYLIGEEHLIWDGTGASQVKIWHKNWNL